MCGHHEEEQTVLSAKQSCARQMTHKWAQEGLLRGVAEKKAVMAAKKKERQTRQAPGKP